MAKVSRFQKYSSDRSGFDGKRISMIKDGPYTVLPEEYDVPPPSKRHLGGEGDIARGEQRPDWDSTDTPTSSTNPVYYITAAGGITPSFAHSPMLICGSNAAINITADPQIAAGRQSQTLTLYCVGSSVQIDNGTGVATAASASFTMTSGSVLTLIYDTGGSVWQETSRTRLF